MSGVSGDQNESGPFTENGRLRVADLPVVENRIRFSLICGTSGRRARSERFKGNVTKSCMDYKRLH